MKLRTASRLAVITLVVVVGAVLYVTRATMAAPRPATLAGTALGGTPAPDVRLVDQRGVAVSLARFRGAPVVLAFVSARCGGACAQTAPKVRAALAQLGAAGARVTVLAVSVDPQRDDPASVAAFVRAQQMTDRWHYLTGTCATLTPVWAAYGVAGSGCEAKQTGTSAQVTQARGVYVLDAHGDERAYLDSSFTAAALATDLRIVSAQ